jgi:bacterioferritin-associated ferredoxin
VAACADALDMDGVTKRFGCGSCCGVCRPYIERMLETGETVFHQIIVAREPHDQRC